jgi:hypothetical protein
MGSARVAYYICTRRNSIACNQSRHAGAVHRVGRGAEGISILRCCDGHGIASPPVALSTSRCSRHDRLPRRKATGLIISDLGGTPLPSQNTEVQDAEDEQDTESVPEFTIFNDDSDDTIRIIVNNQCLFYVSKPVLSLVTWFRICFSGRWNTDGTPGIFELCDDDPNAFRISMQILHHQLQLLPEDLGYSTLNSLASFADKYNMVNTILPQVTHRRWTDIVLERRHSEPKSLLVLPWILQVFGDTKKLREVYKLLASNMYRPTKHGWVIRLGLGTYKVSGIQHKDVPEQNLCSKSIYTMQEQHPNV